MPWPAGSAVLTDAVTDAVQRLIRDDEMSGCNLVLLPGKPTHLLDG